MKFKLPKKFNMFGKTITVRKDTKLYHDSDCSGLAIYRKDEIVLQPSTDSIPITKDYEAQVFFHEFAHFLLYEAGEDCFEPQLHKREFLVDRIGSLLHQAFTSAKV